MATPTTSAREYKTLLARSKLLPVDEVESLYRRWREDPNCEDEQVEQFVKFLISRRVLTPYQAAMIQRGRADGFFLGGYKILDRIGKGQMGGVYKAVHTLGQIVALKILPASRAKDQHTLGRFQREAGLLTRLDHPNVVRAFQVGDDGGRHFIVMEYLEGETLDEVLARRKRLPVGEAARLLHQALCGLQHLHDRRLVHRDFKPSNLMLTPAGGEDGRPDTTWDATVKILDIGLGRELFDENTPEGQIDTQLTAEGAVLGTPDYLAPEQAKDARSADIRADIYSAGCVFYHCVTGRTPFPDTNIMSQMLKHATEKPLPIRDVLPDAPPNLQKVLDKFMAKSPDRRFQTPAEAAETLVPFLTPNQGAAPLGARVVPAYQKWLETESHLELQADLPLDPVPAVKPGTGPTAALPTAPRTATTPPAPRPPAPRPPEPPPPPKPEKNRTARPAPDPQPQRPRPLPDPAPGGWLPAPLPAPGSGDDEVDVELVTNLPVPVPVPLPASNPYPVFPEPVPGSEPAPRLDDRPLWQVDRRDLMMLVAGGAGVLFAVGVGYGLSRLFRRRVDE